MSETDAAAALAERIAHLRRELEALRVELGELDERLGVADVNARLGVMRSLGRKER